MKERKKEIKNERKKDKRVVKGRKRKRCVQEERKKQTNKQTKIRER